MLLLVLLGEVLKSDPALSILNALKLTTDFVLVVPRAFNDFPEGLELVEFDAAVLVDIDLVEELLG